MSHFLGVFRTTAGLKEADELLKELSGQYGSLHPAPYSSYSLETHNILTAAQEVVRGALARKENVGLHFNADLVGHKRASE